MSLILTIFEQTIYLFIDLFYCKNSLEDNTRDVSI